MSSVDRGTRFVLTLKGICGLILCMLPLAFPTAVSVAAETYRQLPSEGQAKLTPNGAATAITLENACGDDSGALGSFPSIAFRLNCKIITDSFETEPEAAAAALNQLAADQVTTIWNLAMLDARGQLSLVNQRLSWLRFTSGIPAFRQAPHEAGTGVGYTGSPTGDDGDMRPWGAYFNLGLRSHDRDKTSFQPGYKANIREFNVGGDLRFDNHMVAGAMLRYADSDLDHRADRGDLNMSNWSALLYGSRSWDSGAFLDLTLGYGVVDYDLDRHVQYAISAQSVDQTASSKPDSRTLVASLGGGYSLFEGAWNLTPQARLNYIRNRIDGFTESMSEPRAAAGSMGMSFDNVTYDSLSSDIGVQVSRAFSYGGAILLPQLSLSWVHEFKTDAEKVTARYTNDVNRVPALVVGDELDANYFDLQLGLSAQFTGGRSAYIAYNTYLGLAETTYNSLDLGLRVEF